MGCLNSTHTAVEPLVGAEVQEEETTSKLSGRRDSAVSKGTADSGVVMENTEIPNLPNTVPSDLPPLTSVSVTESQLLQNSTEQNRPTAREILEELRQQGIIPEGQREAGSGAGEAYIIMLDDSEGFRRRYPARLKSLSVKKAPRSREQIDEKMRLAHERRKSKEDTLKTRLRVKSARIRGPTPVCITEEDEDATITPVVPLQLPVSPDRQIGRKAGEEGEWVRRAGGDGREKSGPAPVCTTKGDEDATITPVVPLQLPVSPDRQIGQKAGEEGGWVKDTGGDDSGLPPVCIT
ncbi:uncharacterized protein LOC114432305 [Parambassis ranga]|uniref:Uncharacterized protein LOC114432305 n=1 Tax=Parambassis ranga TaxID=210632 RepID=A0A6P7HZQ4_9TELE|nr:uncharacterized protein LOC114432305 [Parambassis ranga]